MTMAVESRRHDAGAWRKRVPLMATAIGLAAVIIVVTSLAAGLWDGPEMDLAEFAPPTPTESFDGENAMTYLRAICNLGPRVTASEPMKKQQKVLKDHFEALGAKVEFQNFTSRLQSRPSLEFVGTNTIVTWHPERKRRVLLGVHYDTRPMADKEPAFSTRRGKFLGANDGGSGTAFLMELGRLMPSLDVSVGVDFVFFDAEEYILNQGLDVYFLGSMHFVEEYKKRKRDYQYDAILVLDMIGDKNLTVHPDYASHGQCGPLVGEVWGIAKELGVREFKASPRWEIRDDHEPFLEAGLNAALLIDFDYPHWHRLSDLPDQCSAASLQKVSKVIVEWLKRRK